MALDRHTPDAPAADSSRLSLDEYLLPSSHVRLRRGARTGEPITLPAESNLKPTWRRETRDALAAWLTSGEAERLALLLGTEPRLAWHPAVAWQMYHLFLVRKLPDRDSVRAWEEETHAFGQYAPSQWQDRLFRRLFEVPETVDSILPAGSRQKAHEALQRLVAAWVGAMLPGWTLRPPKRVKPAARRGRTPRWLGWEAELLHGEYSELRGMLNKEPTTAFAQTRRESREHFIDRTAALVQKLHGSSWRKWLYGIGPDDPESDVPKSLSHEVAMKIVTTAMGPRTSRVSKTFLIHGLLAYYEQMTTGAIKGILQRAPAARPARRGRG